MNLVQNAQLKIESQLPNALMTGCTDCELDDAIHVGTDDHRLLAMRLANLATAAVKRGPRPVSAKVKGAMIVVEFAEVNGKLVHKGRLNGFTLHAADGTAVPMIYRQRVSAENPCVVELLFSGKLPEGVTLHHGVGRDPPEPARRGRHARAGVRADTRAAIASERRLAGDQDDRHRLPLISLSIRRHRAPAHRKPRAGTG